MEQQTQPPETYRIILNPVIFRIQIQIYLFECLTASKGTDLLNKMPRVKLLCVLLVSDAMLFTDPV